MTVTLGGVTLSDELTLTIGQLPAGISQRRLIGGASVVQADGSSGGRTLTLAGEHHWTLAQVEQLRSLQAAGQELTLVHHRGTFQVVIADTSELSPSIEYANPTAADWYSGSISMIEV
jgi:hypothetical protein